MAVLGHKRVPAKAAAGRTAAKATAVAAKAPSAPGDKVPRSFVIRKGHVSKVAQALVRDVRRVMEPNTAAKLQERTKGKLKDYTSVALQLGVTHLLMFSQTESATNLRMARLLQGPTCYFRITSFSLMTDVLSIQKKARVCEADYLVAPLLVLNNFPVDTPQGKLMCSMLQGLFPTINTARVKLADVRRVVLFHYDREGDTVEFRHYAIGVKTVGLCKSVKRIVRSQIPDMGNFADAADFVLKAEANLSDSEVEGDSIVTMDIEPPLSFPAQRRAAAGRQPIIDRQGERAGARTQQRGINLIECGPRMTLRLIKVTDGLNAGKVLYHVPIESLSKGDEADASSDGSDLDEA